MKYLEKFLKGFLKDRRGVTPVVGVILMVAVTVVMGAVIAGFVYGYVGTTQKGPLVGLTVTDDPATTGTSFLIKHTGGEEVVEGDWKLSVIQGKDSATLFAFASEAYTSDRPLTDVLVIATGTTNNANLNAGRTLRVQRDTTLPIPGGAVITAVGTHAGFYHVVIVHAPSNSLLLDSNVQVR